MLQVVGLVSGRRRLSKGLMFASLVPDFSGLVIRNSMQLRRSWRHPETGQAVELQLIVGQTVIRCGPCSA